MDDEELLEKIRQAIMRYRELLDLVHQRMAQGEPRYERLFSDLPATMSETLPEKALQREAAR